MGKLPYMYTDSEETDDTASSIENVRKKKRFSILKYTSGNLKKKKCKVHSKSEPDDSDSRSVSRSSQKVKNKLRGILKHDRDREESSDEDEDSEPLRSSRLRETSKYLVGRVPRPVGGKPGRGGGLALVIKKDISGVWSQQRDAIKTNPLFFMTTRVIKAETLTSYHSSTYEKIFSEHAATNIDHRLDNWPAGNSFTGTWS